MCWQPGVHEAAMEMSRLTGIGYESSLMSLKRIDSPPAFRAGRVDAQAFAALTRRHDPELDSVRICDSLSKLNSTSFENAYLDLIRVRPSG